MSFSDDTTPVLINTMPVLLMWGAIVTVVLIGAISSYMARESHYRLLEKLAEKGQPIPPELLTISRRSYRYSGSISGGIFLMCIGIALFIFFWAMTGGGNPLDRWGAYGGGSWLPFVGIFPFMVGFARLLGGIFDRPRFPPTDK